MLVLYWVKNGNFQIWQHWWNHKLRTLIVNLVLVCAVSLCSSSQWRSRFTALSSTSTLSASWTALKTQIMFISSLNYVEARYMKTQLLMCQLFYTKYFSPLPQFVHWFVAPSWNDRSSFGSTLNCEMLCVAGLRVIGLSFSFLTSCHDSFSDLLCSSEVRY